MRRLGDDYATPEVREAGWHDRQDERRRRARNRRAGWALIGWAVFVILAGALLVLAGALLTPPH
jgi:hypothetical protein